MATVGYELDDVQSTFPDWVIWRGASETGPQCWYATRRAVSLSAEQLNAGLAQTVCGDDAPSLVLELERQGEIASQLTRVASNQDGDI
ncbi:hypothetical protein GCM10010116_52450 [Microbispora rosea subsp. aerata]|nr:hypothetical protein [Microbispora rosea]GGO26126.1 hypothetical protein GCM10010116_52450 [Microbispora rosea subsp. aerata]GIH58216.1 hypothetical protein Mro02_51300 [Microbispora rosea subsp. aerata]GLJ87010.1 hypothetical protein GCM10017588_57530 [Microbispora rosea subsp. aerata]